MQTSPGITELIQNIYQWGVDRNITYEGGTTATHQVSKAAEELVELIVAEYSVAAGPNDRMDALGDFLVCLAQAYRMDGTSPEMFALVVEHERGSRVESKQKAFELINAELVLMCWNFGPLELESLRKIVGWLNTVVYSWEILEGLEMAWNEIKDRKGKMIEGKFVKEAEEEEGEKA